VLNSWWSDCGLHSRIAIVFWHRLNRIAVFYELSNRNDDNFKIYYLFAIYELDYFSSVVLFAFLSCASSLLALLRYLVGMSSPSFPRRINLCRSLFFRDSAFEILLPWLKESVDSPGFLGKLPSFSKKLDSLLLSLTLSFSFFFSFFLRSFKFSSSRLILKYIEFSIRM